MVRRRARRELGSSGLGGWDRQLVINTELVDVISLVLCLIYQVWHQGEMTACLFMEWGRQLRMKIQRCCSFIEKKSCSRVQVGQVGEGDFKAW
jgi:hypothetical protein